MESGYEIDIAEDGLSCDILRGGGGERGLLVPYVQHVQSPGAYHPG